MTDVTRTIEVHVKAEKAAPVTAAAKDGRLYVGAKATTANQNTRVMAVSILGTVS